MTPEDTFGQLPLFGKRRLEFDAFDGNSLQEMPVLLAGQPLGESGSRMWRMLISHVGASRARLRLDNVVWL